MPGPAFHLEVLRLAIEALDAGSAADRDQARIMRDNLPFARLGALGPDLLRHRPVPTAALDTIVATADLAALSPPDREALGLQIVPNPEMAVLGAAFRLLVPHYPDLLAIDDLLRRLADIVATEDIERLKAAKDELDALGGRLDALADLKEELRRIYAAGTLAAVLGRPPIQAKDRAAPASRWRPHEYLRWKRTGAFARALLDLADGRGDDQLRAYALGHLTHVAGAVTAEPFVNSIVGGPYRSHWWRNRFVRNYVDAWTFGRYQTPAAMAGDAPAPPYADWRDLCGANLQDQVAVDPGLSGEAAVAAVVGGAMPATPGFDKVADLLIAAVAQAYANEATLAKPPAALSDPAAFREAYVGTLAVLWFMTAAQPLCPQPVGAPPPGAETPPAWFTDGTAPPPAPSGGGGGGGGSSGAATVSAIIAAILAVIAIVTGNILVGVGALVAGIGALINAAEAGDPLDWTEVRGTVYWLRVRFFTLEDGVHKALLKGGVAYPLGRELGTPPSGIFPWLPALDDSGTPLTKARKTRAYPLRMDERAVPGGQPIPADVSFTTAPLSPVEEPGTLALLGADGYPDRVVDGSGLMNGGLLADDGSVPSRDRDFGDAVANAVDLVRAGGAGLVDYNLDGDRGYGWKTWRPRPNTTLADPLQPVQALEE